MNWHDSNDDSLREAWEEREAEKDALDDQMERDGEAEDFARTLAPDWPSDAWIAEFEAWLMVCGPAPRMGPGSSKMGHPQGSRRLATGAETLRPGGSANFPARPESWL